MEDFKKKNGMDISNDREIVFSKSIKAGKRIYYLDVKRNRRGELFLAITESKKVVSEEGEDAQVSFEKHKIFLYKEDFDKFMNGLEETVAFIVQNQEMPTNSNRDLEMKEEEMALVEEFKTGALDGEIKIDVDFE